MNRYLKLTGVLLFTVIGLMVSGCGESVTESEEVTTPTESTEEAEIRFIHSAASTDEIDIYYLDLNNDIFEGIISNAEYGKQYGYYSFNSGTRSFEVYLAGTNLTGATVTGEFEDGGKYSVIATDFDATLNPSLIVFPDTTDAPPIGSAFLRFIHASADAHDIDILGGDDTPIVESLSLYQAAAYIEIDAGTTVYRAVSSDSGIDHPRLDAITLLSGVSYTAILSGSVNGLPGPGFNLKMYPETSIEE